MFIASHVILLKTNLKGIKMVQSDHQILSLNLLRDFCLEKLISYRIQVVFVRLRLQMHSKYNRYSYSRTHRAPNIYNIDVKQNMSYKNFWYQKLSDEDNRKFKLYASGQFSPVNFIKNRTLAIHDIDTSIRKTPTSITTKSKVHFSD